MNLTDLQIQLRSIEEHISSLQLEIEKMKPQPEEGRKAIFEGITKMAAQFPLEDRNLPDESLKKSYITSLVYITLADENKIYDKLLYLCRLAQGMGISGSSEDILRMGMEVDKVYFDKACSELKNVKYSFLTDALILANITEEATDATFSLIADIAKIIECDKEDIRAAAYVAKAVLMDDFNVLQQLPVPSKNRWMGQFRQHIPESWIISRRIKCGQVCKEITRKNDSSDDALIFSRIAFSHNSTASSTATKKADVIKNRLPAGSIVKKGDELVVYEETNVVPALLRFMNTTVSTENKTETVSIKSPCDGVVVFIEDEKEYPLINQTWKLILVYVVSYFDDYDRFCQWYNQSR